MNNRTLEGYEVQNQVAWRFSIEWRFFFFFPCDLVDKWPSLVLFYKNSDLICEDYMPTY